MTESPELAAPGTSMSRAALAASLREAVGADGVFTEDGDLAGYERGWRYGVGKAHLVVKPRTTEAVAAAVRVCSGAGVPVQPIGANTGLVGASNPDASGDMVVLSLERLQRHIEFDERDGTVVVDAGVLLSQLNEALKPHGRFFPIDLGADPQIGGMVVTNTGGSRLVRYGDVRANLLGLEVVLPTGEVVSDLRRLHKNNTGLDSKHLFVGTSGAFGIVTRAVLRTWPLPRQRAGALVLADSGDAVIRLLQAIEPRVGEFLTAFEAISGPAAEAVVRHGAFERNPYDGAPPAYSVLVELSTGLDEETLDLDDLLGGALMAAMEAEGAGLEDVIVGEADEFWHLRHQVSECLAHEGSVLGLDVSTPRGRMAEFTDAVRRRLADTHPFVRVCDFGHWGDGGSHLNLVWPRGTVEDEPALKSELQRFVYDLCVREFGGSYSAEHGIGPHNIEAYRRYTPDWVRRMAATIAPKRFGTVEL